MLVTPERTVRDNPWMDGVDSRRRNLDRQRLDQAHHRTVHRCYRRGAWIWCVLRTTTKKKHRTILFEATTEMVHDSRVSCDLDGGQHDGPVYCIVDQRIAIPHHARNHNVIHLSHRSQCITYRVRLRQIEAETSHLSPARRHRLGNCVCHQPSPDRIPSAENYVVTFAYAGIRERQTHALRCPDNDDVLHEITFPVDTYPT